MKLFFELCKPFTNITNTDSFNCKSTSSHFKLQLDTPDDYRKIIHFLKDSEAKYHQLQSDKAFRVKINNLYPVSEISTAVGKIGHSVKQVTNIIHHQTKISLHLYFVNL